MRVLVLHEPVAPDAGFEAQDTQLQATTVLKSLTRRSHEVVELAFDLDLGGTMESLRRHAPDVVFNLVESLAGTDRLASMASALLDAMDVPYTGAPTRAAFLAGDKLLAKLWMSVLGIPTPAWHVPGERNAPHPIPAMGRRVIMKSAWEHASVGIDEEGIVPMRSLDELDELARQRSGGAGGESFFEEFVDGREFNLSILDGVRGPEVLPPAEIIFDQFGDRPRIVGYNAKWDAGSFEYSHTPRSFEFAADECALLGDLARLALECWTGLGLRGYARVDFRVDTLGSPWVLEVNANPCLAPDAGFAAALVQAGIEFDDAIDRILQSTGTTRR